MKNEPYGIWNKLSIPDELEHNVEPIEEDELKFNENHNDDVNDDYQKVRSKLHLNLKIAQDVLPYAVYDVKRNPGPRGVEAISALLKIMTESCDRLQSMHEKHNKMLQTIKPKASDDDEINEFEELDTFEENSIGEIIEEEGDE